MKLSTIPGFSEVFPNEQATYAELVSEINSDTIITLCTVLNSELTCPEPYHEIHARLNRMVLHRFTDVQHNFVINALRKFKEKAGNGFQGLIFFRKYLIAMILKELNAYRIVTVPDDEPRNEYQFFRAYLKVIDEVNSGMHRDIDFKQLDSKDPLRTLRLCWMPILRQFELNERGNIIFEMLKAACFLDFATKAYREPLRNYLDSFGFSSPGELISSFNAIYQATELYNPNEMLRKYTLINIDENTNTKHLEAQTISPEPNGQLNFGDLKKRPVFFSPRRQKHIVLDNYLAQRKVFRGPYFELFHQTTLKPKEKALQNEAFVRYSQRISDVLEKRCLKPILTLLANKGCDIVHFDDGSHNVPDGYLRIGRNVFLFEYKASFFPEKLANNPNFEELKSHFDKVFIANEKGKEKGINQLKKQISLIYNGGFVFDPESKILLDNGGLTIHPIITYNDFYFGINGLNLYLYNAFFKSLPSEFADKMIIVPLVLMNLESLLDMVLMGQGVTDLKQHIHSYLGLISTARERLKITGNQLDFQLAHSGFDELYNGQFASKPGDLEKTHEILNSLLQLAELSFDDLERPLD